MDYISKLLEPYMVFVPYFLIGCLSAFLLTPIIGFLCKKYGIVDIPAQMRNPREPSIKTRIKKIITPRAGGLAIIIPFLILLPIATNFERHVIGILIATIIISIGSFLDDKLEIGSKLQFLFQICAALVIVASGISIDSVQNPFGHSINLRLLEIPLGIIRDTSIALPADIITFLWILTMVNAINWVFGSDGLGEGITFIALITIFLINVEASLILVAFIAILSAAGLLGFLPYNLPPAKILNGTTGTTFLGFIIAVSSIMGGAKVSSAIIVLIIPIIDMIWVMIGRIQRNKVTEITQVLKITTIGDDTHLHHRLLKLGFTTTQVALIEWTAVAICAVIAFLTADLPKMVIIGSVTIFVLIIFIVISFLLKKGVKVNGVKKEEKEEEKKPPGPQETPESKYAY